MKNIKTIFITIIFLLPAISVWAADSSVSASKSCYNHAVKAFNSAQRAEETAKVSLYPDDIASYYEIALKNYKLALGQSQRSAEESEQLSKSEIQNRKHFISECLRKIKICKNKYDDAIYRKYYDNAVRDFNAAQRAEENARFYSRPVNKADYYRIAIKNYKLALKQAQYSAEKLEELSEREKNYREYIINECRERIDVCKKRYSNAMDGSVLEDLRQKAYRYIIAGFNYATADDKRGAKRNWNKAISLYQEALMHTDDRAVQEVIKSKIQTALHYLEYLQE